MLQQVMTKPGEIIFQEVPVPEVKDDQVLVKIRNIGVCGSDIHVYHGKHPFTKYPVTQGHEVSGEIVKTGKAVTEFHEGQKVTIEPQVYCSHCYPCRHGKYNLCEELKVMGFQTTGTASEYFSVDASKVTLLPEEMSYEEGAMIEPLAVAVHAVKQMGDVKGMNIAVIGAGPAGIVCAYHLLRLGRPVDVFEMEQEAGGMARWGIPSYRLPRAELAGETDIVKTLGGHYRYGEKLGRDFHLNDLFAQGYDAVFLGIGCARGQFLGLPDEDQNAQGYLRGLDFLLEVEHSQGTPEGPKPLEGDVVVIGCGNVAMDCCRTARRIVKPGCQVTVAYRRIEASAPADPEEIHAARAEGIRFEFLSAPKRILVENGRVVGIELVRMHQTEPDASGRRAVKPLPGSEFIIPCSYVIAAIGQKMDPTVFIPEDGIALTRWGTIETKENFTTMREGVFAGGDAATGPKTLILAMAQGEAAAKSIDQYLKTREPAFFPRTRLSQIIAKAKLVGACRPTRPLPIEARYTSKFLDPEARSANWEEVEGAMTIEEARQESQRCMRCMRLIAVTTRNPVVEHEPTAPNAATF